MQWGELLGIIRQHIRHIWLACSPHMLPWLPTCTSRCPAPAPRPPQGIFTSAMLSAPLLLIMFIILVRAQGGLLTHNGPAPGCLLRICCPSTSMPNWVFPSEPPASPLQPLQVNYLITTSVLLVRMKRKELAYRARQQRRRGEGGGGAQPRQQAAVEPKKEQ